MSKKIFLIGLPGSGKTTAGLDLAHELGVQFVDLDQEIEKDAKQQVSELFAQKGEAHFRQLEKFHLEKIIKSLTNFVMATGGGTPCFFDNLSIMKKSGSVIYMNTTIEEIKRRLKHDTTRPLLKESTLDNLLSTRKAYYEQADDTIADYTALLKLFK